jgi:hypothetical protein
MDVVTSDSWDVGVLCYFSASSSWWLRIIISAIFHAIVGYGGRVREKKLLLQGQVVCDSLSTEVGSGSFYRRHSDLPCAGYKMVQDLEADIRIHDDSFGGLRASTAAVRRPIQVLHGLLPGYTLAHIVLGGRLSHRKPRQVRWLQRISRHEYIGWSS